MSWRIFNEYVIGGLIGGSLGYIARKKFADGIMLPLLLWLTRPLRRLLKRQFIKTEKDVAIWMHYQNKQFKKARARN